MSDTADERYMKEALKQAKKAAAIMETPIGCVIVRDGKIIARGYNKRNLKKNTLAHAEILAINKASRVVGDWRLEDCTLYVTLEPCPMCAGAIVQARISRVVIGAMNGKAGCAGHERQSGLRRVGRGSAAPSRLQPPGSGGDRRSGRRLRGHAFRIFQRTAPRQERGQSRLDIRVEKGYTGYHERDFITTCLKASVQPGR